MLSYSIKEATKTAHQQLEVVVVKKLKAIRSNADYADLLKHFYAYFNAVEKAIDPFITKEVLPDYGERRNSSYIRRDIESLGFTIDELPEAQPPAITSIPEALGALYVMEGSIMGGRIIVQMLEKGGITNGVSFFSGYGEDTGKMWGVFTGVMNQYASAESAQQQAIKAANETFSRFGQVFSATAVN